MIVLDYGLRISFLHRKTVQRAHTVGRMRQTRGSGGCPPGGHTGASAEGLERGRHSRDWVSFHASGPEARLSGEGIQEFLGAHVLRSVVTVGA